MLAEIYLCHACSDHEIEDGNGAPGPAARISAVLGIGQPPRPWVSQLPTHAANLRVVLSCWLTMTQHALLTAHRSRPASGCSGSAAPGTLSVEEAFELLLAAREEQEEGEQEEEGGAASGAAGLAARGGGGRVASLAARRGLSESQLADLLKYHAPGARARPGVGPLRAGGGEGGGRGGAVGVAGGQRCLPPGCARRSRARPRSRAGSGRDAGVEGARCCCCCCCCVCACVSLL
eukprot:COSAG01_NODE_3839_length_5646_cov_8.715934_7_plen_234_part_00